MRKVLLLSTLMLMVTLGALAQGVTTASISGTIKDTKGEGIPGASIVATHMPSGTTYGTISQADGKFIIPSMRIGGPYTVKVSFVGFQEAVFQNIYLSLGTASNLNARLTEQSQELGEVVVAADRGSVFSSDRTGASTNIRVETINALPTINRSFNDLTRLTPQASGQSFLGADPRFNNITIDGSSFNNSFGLAGQPGGRTGSSPISLDAIEEIQVNMAPYDVRQAGFVGAGVNMVTRSGTNDFSGSAFYNFRNESLVGNKANGQDVTTNNFDVKQYGLRLGGPIIKNKLFFFVSTELERASEPATTFLAARPGLTGNNVTRVQAADLDSLSAFLRTNFNYETGGYENYPDETTSDKVLVKLDYNISNNHKLSVRYNFLDSQDDVLVSTSSSLGRGNRRGTVNSLNFRNSNYIQKEKIQSIIGELNSRFGSKITNNLIVGYTNQNEDRGSLGSFFPLVEILQGGTNYTTFGFEPFTPNNRLEYKTFQFQDNVTFFAGSHIVTAGVNTEILKFRNVFFPGSQSVYVYNSLADFYTDANAYLANPNLTTAPVTLNRFQLRYSALPGGAEPVQPTEVTYTGLYVQDEFNPIPNLKLTVGIRGDIPFFKETGYYNPTVAQLTFKKPGDSPTGEDATDYKINTSKLPDPKVLVSPRFGFNYNLKGENKTQIRGGTGIFTGRPAFVWISNQIGNNGVLTGFEQLDATTNRPFKPSPTAYVPATPTLPSSVEIAATDPDFKFPQIWRSNLAVDQKLPLGLVGTLELIYSKDVNGVAYFNANEEFASGSFSGPDSRPYYPGYNAATGQLYTSSTNPTINNAIRINDNVVNAITLTNSNKGSAYSISAKLEKPLSKGLFGLVGYNFGSSRNLIDAGSIAAGSYFGNAGVNGNNYVDAAYSSNDQRHRVIASVSYRKEYAGFGATQIGLFWEGRNQGRFSYVYDGDLNGDGTQGNDLLYVPRDASEMNFQQYTQNYTDANNQAQSRVFTVNEQVAAWEAYIGQDEYLKNRRGSYAERNGALMPWVFRADFSLVQEFFMNIREKRNTLQLRVDIINVGNLINSDWGVGNFVGQTRPLTARGFDPSTGRPLYRLRNEMVNGVPELITTTFKSSAGIPDVWRAQFGIRYIFN